MTTDVTACDVLLLDTQPSVLDGGRRCQEFALLPGKREWPRGTAASWLVEHDSTLKEVPCAHRQMSHVPTATLLIHMRNCEGAHGDG
jgi:hypothetical protein